MVKSWLRKLFGGAGYQSAGGATPCARRAPGADPIRWNAIEDKVRQQVRGLVSRTLLDDIYGRPREMTEEDEAFHLQEVVNRIYAEALYDILKAGEPEASPAVEPAETVLAWVQKALETWAGDERGPEGAKVEDKAQLIESVIAAFQRAAADDVLKRAAAARIENENAAPSRR